MPSRMGKSYSVPLLRILAGARLTVIRLAGKRKPLLLAAARTRSRASLTAASRQSHDFKGRQPIGDKAFRFHRQPQMPESPSARTLQIITFPLCVSGTVCLLTIAHFSGKYKSFCREKKKNRKIFRKGVIWRFTKRGFGVMIRLQRLHTLGGILH